MANSMKSANDLASQKLPQRMNVYNKTAIDFGGPCNFFKCFWEFYFIVNGTQCLLVLPNLCTVVYGMFEFLGQLLLGCEIFLLTVFEVPVSDMVIC